MAEKKYGHLIKPITYNKVEGEGAPEYTAALRGPALEGFNAGFVHGFRRTAGPWGGHLAASHVHPYNETMLFAGVDYDHPNELPAKLTIGLGEEGEVHTIDKPAVVVCPAGTPHGPIATESVDKPYIFLAVVCNAVRMSEDVATHGETDGHRYDDLVQPFEMRHLKRENSGNADWMTGWSGERRQGFKLNFTWAFHTGVGPFHTHDPHVHPNDECLVFVGTDPDRPDYLGAEVEIFMGEEMESHVFDTPTAVVAPAGLVHCPLVIRRVEHPYNFTAICLNNSHDTTWLGGDPNVPNRYAHPPRRE
jgi:hypothetical protein